MSDTNKTVTFGLEATEKILSGVDTLANAVKVTMGPRGQNVVIERPGRPPHLTKDGVSVARAINLRSKLENLGVQMVKEAAQRSAEVAGDGTTTATVLAQSLYSEGLMLLSAGYKSSDIIKGITFAVADVIEELENVSVPVLNEDEIIQVGTISANGEESIGKYISEAMSEVGKDGIITIEEARGFDTTLSLVDGVQIDRGYLSPYFVTNNDKMTAEMKDPLVFLSSKKLSSLQEIVPLLEEAHSSSRPLLIVAPDVDGDALQGLVVNKMKGTLQVCAIQSPGFGSNRLEMMQDLSTILGCEIYNDVEDKKKVTEYQPYIGSCKKVSISRGNTLFIGGKGDEEKIKARKSAARRMLRDQTLSDPEIEIIKTRMSILSGKVAVIKVGGSTEIEMLERKDRVEDALHATQAAIEEGIVPGGGVALVRSAKILERKKKEHQDGVRAGYEVVTKACMQPLKQIVINSGGSAEVVLDKVARASGTKGYDAKSEKHVDMFVSGIVDPAKVVRSALTHASSAACNLLSVGCAMVEDDFIDQKETFFIE